MSYHNRNTKQVGEVSVNPAALLNNPGGQRVLFVAGVLGLALYSAWAASRETRKARR